MNIGTWNVQGLGTKQAEVITELEKQKMSIAVLTETKKKGQGIEDIGNYIHIYSGVNRELRAKKDVPIMINKNLDVV